MKSYGGNYISYPMPCWLPSRSTEIEASSAFNFHDSSYNGIWSHACYSCALHPGRCQAVWLVKWWFSLPGCWISHLQGAMAIVTWYSNCYLYMIVVYWGVSESLLLILRHLWKMPSSVTIAKKITSRQFRNWWVAMVCLS